MGVNDLASTLRADTAFQSKGDYRAASLVDEVARTAWHPVSEPPTEADAHDGVVMVVVDRYVAQKFWDAPLLQGCDYWARVEDVVLLPPQSTTGEGE